MPVLFLYGAAGVGKSTVAFEIFARLRSANVPIARVELDDIGYLHRDTSSADPGGHRLRARNLASMWSNFQAAGAAGLIVSGAVSDHGQVELYRAAIPRARWTLCRLRARPETMHGRILARGRLLGVGTPGGISGFTAERLRAQADGAAAYAEQLEQKPLSDLAIDTDGRTVPDIARDVVRRAGNWPALG